MAWKIERVIDHGHHVLRLSGHVQSEHLTELNKQLGGQAHGLVLDLDGVTLVDRDVVRFLNICEERGVKVQHCWPYIREWMTREKGRQA